MEQTLQPQTEELSKKDFKIPVVIKDKVLMAPGPWNGVHYTGDEIKRAFDNTDWKDKDNVSLILDHADKPLSVHDWVGWVRNPKMIGDNLLGDLEIYDENVLIKLLKAKAKFGISPRVKGIEHNNEFRNFTFENFSIVTNPAVKKAYINLSQNKLKGGKMTEKELQENTEEETTEDDNSQESAEQEAAGESEDKEEIKEMRKKKEDDKKMKKKKYPNPEEDDVSDEEMLEITQMSSWTDFVKKMKKKYPKMPFKSIASAFKKSSKENQELEELSEEELIEKIEALTNILRRKKKYEKPDEEMSAEKRLSAIEEQVRRISEEPGSKSIESTQELSDKPIVLSKDENHHTKGVLEMASFLSKFR